MKQFEAQTQYSRQLFDYFDLRGWKNWSRSLLSQRHRKKKIPLQSQIFIQFKMINEKKGKTLFSIVEIKIPNRKLEKMVNKSKILSKTTKMQTVFPLDQRAWITLRNDWLWNYVLERHNLNALIKYVTVLLRSL